MLQIWLSTEFQQYGTAQHKWLMRFTYRKHRTISGNAHVSPTPSLTGFASATVTFAESIEDLNGPGTAMGGSILTANNLNAGGSYVVVGDINGPDIFSEFSASAGKTLLGTPGEEFHAALSETHVDYSNIYDYLLNDIYPGIERIELP